MIKTCLICFQLFDASRKAKCCSKECSKNLRKQTCLEKYGGLTPMSSQAVKNKKNQTCLEKYGFSQATQSEEIKNKVKQTCIEKYGVENPFQNEEIKNKIKLKTHQTSLEKYGVEHIFQSDEVKDKIKQTCLEKYGVDNAMKSEEIKNKVKQTCLEKYSGIAPVCSQDVKDKIKQTCLEKYGVEYALQSEKVKEKIKQTNLEKYGSENFQQLHIPKEFLTKEWWEQRKNFLEAKEIIGDAISYSKVYLKAHQFRPDWDFQSLISQPHQRVINLLNQHQIIYETNTRQVIKPLELDIYIPSKHLAIEVNGVYWHSDLNGKDKNYHLNKTLECEKQGIQLLQFWDIEIENQWNIIQSMILSKLEIYQTRIGARKCKVIQVPNMIEKCFLNENHLQGYRPSSICLGLEYQDELVSIMSFSKPRFSNKSNWELLRFCNKINTQVIGGASKLFEKRPKGSIISYSDKRYSNGDLYTRLKMVKQKSSAPSYYYMKNYQSLENRMKYQKHKLYEKLELHNPELTEWENMMNNGYDRIWDCGNFVFKM